MTSLTEMFSLVWLYPSEQLNVFHTGKCLNKSIVKTILAGNRCESWGFEPESCSSWKSPDWSSTLHKSKYGFEWQFELEVKLHCDRKQDVAVSGCWNVSGYNRTAQLLFSDEEEEANSRITWSLIIDHCSSPHGGDLHPEIQLTGKKCDWSQALLTHQHDMSWCLETQAALNGSSLASADTQHILLLLLWHDCLWSTRDVVISRHTVSRLIWDAGVYSAFTFCCYFYH